MSLLGAVDRINTWAVTGVTTNYGLDDLPGVLSEVVLPSLVLAGGDGGGGKPFDLGLTSANVVVFMTHTLVLRGAGVGRPQNAFYGLVTLIDNYVAKVKTDWMLNANLSEPLQIVETTFKPVVYGSVTYFAVVFKHRWTLTL